MWLLCIKQWLTKSLEVSGISNSVSSWYSLGIKQGLCALQLYIHLGSSHGVMERVRISRSSWEWPMLETLSPLFKFHFTTAPGLTGKGEWSGTQSKVLLPGSNLGVCFYVDIIVFWKLLAKPFSLSMTKNWCFSRKFSLLKITQEFGWQER
jgi:hypothetical protein